LLGTVGHLGLLCIFGEVVQVGNSLKITVPKELAAHLELKKGDKVLMWVDNSHAVLEKKKV
jgi:antitoxin component of MazEF toxin-antitoxin module